jgi:hypothetical protein
LPETTDGILHDWLNDEQFGGVTFYCAPKTLTFPAPKFDAEDNISMQERSIEIEPGTFLPFETVDKQNQKVSIFWPPEGSPAPISLDAESAARCSSQKADADHGIVVTNEGQSAFHVLCSWPKSLNDLMPLLGGADDLLSYAKMARLAKMSENNLPQAFREATLASTEYQFDGYATVEHSWLRPALEERSPAYVIFKAEDRA